MKNSILTLTIIAAGILLCSLLIGGCGGNKEADHSHTGSDTTANHADQVAYACPMHPDVTGKEGDTCNQCGMKLEAANADSVKTDQHQH